MTSTANEKQRPVHEIRLGGVNVAIWKNHSEKAGTWHTFTISRLYKQGDTWKRSDSFGPTELPLVSRAIEMAGAWVDNAELMARLTLHREAVPVQKQ